MTSLLEVADLHASYGEIEVLRGVNLHVNPKETVTIIGPNGAGKSTLFRTIFGLLKARKGSVKFEGRDITNMHPVSILKSGISYIFQEESIFPKMTIYENLEMGAFTRGDKEEVKEDIERLLKMFPILEDRKKTNAEKLSGGERKILVLARALLLSPKLILLDEPTAGLSPKMMDTVFEEIKKIHRQGTTLIIVEQNARKSLAMSDRGYVLAEGQVRFEGTGEEILSDEQVKRLYLGG